MGDAKTPTRTRTRKRPASPSECAMAVVDWQEKHEAAARAFAADANDETRRQLHTAGYAVWHWHRELAKAKKREGIP